MIKAVGQATPSYCMSTFLFYVSLLDKLQKILNSYWWGSKQGGLWGINWLNWERMYVSKKDGGLGFRNLQAFNLAFLGKEGWKLVSDPNAIVSKVFKGRFTHEGIF